MVSADDDVLVLYRLDGFGPRNDLQKGLGYLSDRPLAGFTPRTFYVHDRTPELNRANEQSSFGRFGNAIECNLNAGGSIWRWCFGGPADDVMYDISATGSATTTIHTSQDHKLAVGDFVIMTKGIEGMPGFWDRLHEVVAITHARAFTIKYQNSKKVQTLTGPYGIRDVTVGATTTVQVDLTNAPSDLKPLRAGVGRTFLFQFTELPPGVTGLTANFSYNGTVSSVTATQLEFTIPVATGGSYSGEGGLFFINYAPRGFVNGGREISNRHQGFGRQIQPVMFFRTVGEEYTYNAVAVGATTRVAMDRPHGLAQGDRIAVDVSGDTGSIPLNGALSDGRIWTAEKLPTFVVTGITKANPAVCTVGTNLGAFLGKKVGEKFGVRLADTVGTANIPTDEYFTATLLTSGASSSTFSIAMSTANATGTYATTGTARIYSDRCLLPGGRVESAWAPTNTTGGTGYTTGKVRTLNRSNPTMAGNQFGGPYEDGLGPLPGEDCGAPCISVSGKDVGNSFVIEAMSWPLEFSYDGVYDANQGYTHFGKSHRPAMFPFFRLGYQLTLNFDGLTGLHQFKSIVELDRDIGSPHPDVPDMGCPTMHLRYGLGAPLTTTDAAIVTVSTANPAEITTAEAHGFVSGDTVVHFADGAIGPDPAFFDVPFQITVLTPTTYTVAYDNSAGAPFDPGVGSPIARKENVEGRLYAMNCARTDLGVGGLQLLSGVTVPDSSPAVQYDVEGGANIDSTNIVIAGQDLSDPGPPPSNPLIRKFGTVAISSVARTTAGKLSFTLASPHGVPIGRKLVVVLAGVTGTPDINYNHIATITGATTFTIEQSFAGTFTGGTANLIVAAGGLIYATSEPTSDFAIGLYGVHMTTNNPDDAWLRVGVGSWIYGRNKFSNSNDPESSDTLILGCTSGRQFWPKGRHETNTYITLYREVTNDAALTCATAMALAYQRGYS